MKNCSAAVVLALFSILVCGPAHAQEVSPVTGIRSVNLFAEVTAARSGQGVGAMWGGSAGAALQGHFLGFVLRGTALPSNSSLRMYTAVLGPRVTVSLPIFRVYAEAGGGMGHTGYYSNGLFGTSWAPAWQINAGLSHGILPHLDWRVVELAYGRIYAGPGVSPEMISTGLAFHL